MKTRDTVYLLFVLLIFIAGLAVRLYDLQDAPLDFHPTRQLHSALMARGMYYSLGIDATVTEEQRQLAIRQWHLEGLVEPPLLEWLVAVTYRLAGGVFLWIPRLYVVGFWLLAAFGILIISKDLIGRQGSLVSLSFFLFYPYSIFASRSFQPETLLVASLVFTFWAALKWHQHQNWRWAIVAGLISGMAILIKAVAVFFVAGIWLGLLFSRMKVKDAIKSRQLWLIGILCLLPYGLFLLYANAFAGGYSGQFSLRFFPQLWAQAGFYLRWAATLRKAVGLEWLVLGLLGAWLASEKTWRWMLLGAWLGYFALGFSLSYHISSHDYYNLPVYLMVSLGLGFLIQNAIHSSNAKLLTRLIFPLLLLFVVAIYGYEAYSTLKKTDFSQETAFWQKMGMNLGMNSKVIALSEDYGYRLAYWGWLSPVNWMTTKDIQLRKESGQQFDFQQYFDSTIQGKDYFLVTLINELNQQPELMNALLDHYHISFQDSRAIIFDLKNKK